MPVEDIAKVLDKGEPILVFDDSEREGETDIFFSAKHVTPASVRFLRKQGGGMVFLASDYAASEKLGLPFTQDLYRSVTHDSGEFDLLNGMLSHSLPYDTRSSFSLFINHKDTFTGITDNDRSLTAKSFAELMQESSYSSGTDCKVKMAAVSFLLVILLFKGSFFLNLINQYLFYSLLAVLIITVFGILFSYSKNSTLKTKNKYLIIILDLYNGFIN